MNYLATVLNIGESQKYVSKHGLGSEIKTIHQHDKIIIIKITHTFFYYAMGVLFVVFVCIMFY